MADIRISNTGGNFSSTATWDGGVVPGVNDVVSGDTNSGQLTLTDNRTVQRLELSGYTNTLTLNAATTLTTSLASATNRFGSGMSFAGTGTYTFNNLNGFIQSNTTSRIPNFRTSTTLTLLTDLYLNNYTTIANINVNGSGLKLYVDGNLTLGSPSGGLGGTATVVMDGTGSITSPGNLNGIRNGMTLEFNTTGTTTLSSLVTVAPITLRYVTGNIVFPTAGTGSIQTVLVANQTLTLDNLTIFSGCNFSWFFGNTGSLNQTIINLVGTNNLGKVLVNKPGQNDNYNDVRISGQTGFTTTINQLQLTGADAAKGVYLSFTPTSTYNITRLFSMGTPFISGSTVAATSYNLIRSNTSGTKAIINIGDNKNSPVFYTAFRDINNTLGQALKTWNGIVVNSDNITTYTTDIFPTSSGGTSQTAYTFAS